MKFVLKNMEDALNKKWPEAEIFHGADMRTGLYELDDFGKPIRLISVDGGEPEDQSFRRDWGWVLTELNKLAQMLERPNRDKAILEAVEALLKACEKCDPAACDMADLTDNDGPCIAIRRAAISSTETDSPCIAIRRAAKGVKP